MRNAALFVVLVGFFGLTAPAVLEYSRLLANGEAFEIFRGRQGRYELAVGIQPRIPVVGVIHFSVTPLSAETSGPVSGAQVVVTVHDEAGTPTYQARALNTPDAPSYYESNITFERAGDWTVVIEVSSAELGVATFRVPLRVGEAPLVPGPGGAFVWLAVVLILTAGAAFVFRGAWRRRQQGRLS